MDDRELSQRLTSIEQKLDEILELISEIPEEENEEETILKLTKKQKEE